MFAKFLDEQTPQQLLVIVNDNDIPFQVVESDNSGGNIFLFNKSESEFLNWKKIISIGKDIKTDSTLSLNDTITFEELGDEVKHDLLSERVSFQGSDVAVRDLIGDSQSNDILNLQSIEEFRLKGNQERKAISLYSRSKFEKSLYITRKMKFDFDFDEKLWDELAEVVNEEKKKGEPKTTARQLQEQYRIKTETGVTDWIAGLKKHSKEQIWHTILKTRNEKREKFEHNLVNEQNWKRRAVIIKGVAGTGKSTVLSHYCNQIKKKNANVWAIRIDLKEHFEAISQMKRNADLSGAINFISSLPNVVDSQSPFALSLLRYRLKTGDRIVLVLDGFDEIDMKCQDIVIALMKALIDKEHESVRLYVTTRPDVADNLELQLGQLAYTLVNFSAEDQVKCLTSFWTDKINKEF